MKAIAAFLCGALEFRRSFTTHYRDWRLSLAYDRGRDLARRLTMRRFEP